MELLRMIFSSKEKAQVVKIGFKVAEDIRFPQSLAGCKDIGLTWGIEQVENDEWAFVVNVSD